MRLFLSIAAATIIWLIFVIPAKAGLMGYLSIVGFMDIVSMAELLDLVVICICIYFIGPLFFKGVDKLEEFVNKRNNN